MPDGKSQPAFLNSAHARILTAVLLLQALLFYTLSHGEAVPPIRPLGTFPARLNGWTLAQEGVIEKEVLNVLKADDTLNRIYAQEATGRAANLFVAYFKTQRTGQTPHSPKNCLPGSGWVPSEASVVDISVPGEQEPIRVNRYIVARGTQKSVVLYWYQTRSRVIASEYMAKIHLVIDSIRYRRSDTALVRVVVPFEGDAEEQASKTAVAFVQSFFGPLCARLPS